MNEYITMLLNNQFDLGRANWRRRSNRKAVTIDEIIASIAGSLTTGKRLDLMSELPTLQKYLSDTLDKLLHPDPSISTGIVYHTEQDYIKAKCNAYGFSFSDRGDKIWRVLPNGNRKVVDLGEVESKLEADLDAYNSQIPEDAGRKFKISTVKANLRSMIQDSNINMLSGLQDSITFDTTKSEITLRWLKNLHHVMQITESQELWVMLMSHMMWLVKRRIFGLGVRSDIWISIFGGQNVGKTYVFTNCIFKPINAYYVMTELSKIEDVDREVAKFTNNFVVNFDEIALGSSGMDDNVNRVSEKMLQNLKSILTRDELYIRRMGGQDQMKLDKTFVAVSSANSHLYDVIFDKTGMRRFFEFNTNAEKQYDNDLIAKLADMSTDAWQGIDENLPKGYWDQSSELGQEVFRIQKTYRPKNNVSEWISGETVKHSDTNTVDVKHAYTSYKAYCQAMGLKPYSMPAFRDVLDYYHTVHEDGTVAITIGKVVQPVHNFITSSQPIDDVWSNM